MNLDKSHFTELVKSFKIKELFNELGWDRTNITLPISIEEEIFTLSAVAEKRGFLIFVCSPDSSGKIPIKDVRKKIDNKITKLYFEHLIIYTDKENSHQIWQLVIREQDKPIIVRETDYFSTQHPELLFQKLRGIFISLDDEDKVTIADVRANVREQFNANAEKVTKKFYTEFKTHHTAFLKFIEGIEDKVSREWYASLMLNRLMFIYFIQKKGFLDNNPHYLSDKLKETKKKKGDNKFFSFYRNFLLVLFHQGLGSPERSEKLLKEIGKVPYLNGGLFDVHQIEKEYKKIEIEDKAFEKIFKFFDEYNWHLDTKITATGRDINPDVIGYIFEKYINDRAAMGAYYTKEDITEYIAKNTIIPFLFDQVKKDCANAFKDESSLWKMLQDNPDRYIYDSVKYGIYEEVIASGSKQSQLKVKELPDYISIGLDTSEPNLLERRKEWNKAAPPEFALPTEIWREVVERRNRYFDIKSKIEKSEIREINDFITYNLNIRQFAQDSVQQYEGSDFINAFYKAITKITVLDPTCGSGAFLFAALNVLEPLYYGCIERMKGFIEDDDKQGGHRYPQFRKVLEEIAKHPNQQYYIYKSIILNNLYGVDIMNEAVEIAKLRLFLKLVAEVEAFEHLEPLPDVDFNIRAGNTLIGYANKKEIDELGGLFVTQKMKDKIFDECEIVSKAFKRFKEIQVEGYKNKNEFARIKNELNERLYKLKTELDSILHKQYYEGVEYNKWIKTHQPFHWFAEFYEIIVNDGFDVIIGNPPYVEYNSKVRSLYALFNFDSIECNNLYGFVIERSYKVSNNYSKIGMIVPLSLISTNSFKSVQKYLNESLSFISNYAATSDPGILFVGVKLQLTIFISHKKKIGNTYSTNYVKWFIEERDNLFERIKFLQSKQFAIPGSIPKISNQIEIDIINKIRGHRISLYSYNSDISNQKLYYKKYGNYFFKIFLDFIPYFAINGKKSKSGSINTFNLRSGIDKYVFLALFNSDIYYYYYMIHSDCRNINIREFSNFYFDYKLLTDSQISQLSILAKQLMEDVNNNSRIRTENLSSGDIRKVQIFDKFKFSKPIINKIDTVLSECYGFTEEELDFIINYDIKYRMGKELEEE